MDGDKEVVLSTGDIKRDYDIVKIIAVAQTVRSWIVESGGREVKPPFHPDLCFFAFF